MELPREFDDYELVRALDPRGTVWLALDTVLARHVVLKFVGDLRPPERRRFLLEARAIARVQHPNVLTIHRVAEHDSRPYLVCEFVHGRSLADVERPVAGRALLEIAIGLARGLAAAHAEGVLHRDLKPANAMLANDGTAKLIDFGFAALEDGAGDARARPAWVGTPDYMAPEVWRREPATRQSDVYSLGALLYELATGHPPYHDVPPEDLRATVLERDVPPIDALTAAGLPPGLGETIERCLRRLPAERPAAGGDVRARLEEIERSSGRALPPAGNPYRGLLSFEAEHQAVFFGRGPEIGAVVDRLRHRSFVLVSGDSGVGKSSLCRAGVLPAIREAALRDGRDWSAVAVVPGRRPWSAWRASLGDAAGCSADELSSAETAEELIHQLVRRLGKGRGIVLLVDQLEELVTIADPAERDAAGALLGRIAAGTPSLKLLASSRADFLAALSTLDALGPEIDRALYFLRPIPAERVRDVVEGPARVTGVRFESKELVDELVGAAAGGATLPLLQFALAELWESRDAGHAMVTAASLRTIGGVAGALSRHADEVVARMSPAVRTSARAILVRMVSGAGTRTPIAAAELRGGSETAAALVALLTGRLIAIREDPLGTVYELAHDVLVQKWGTLVAWVQEDADMRAVRSRVAAAATEWDRLGLPAEALWGRRHLAEARDIAGDQFLPRERAFLDASRRRQRRRAAAFFAAVILVPALVAGAWTLPRLQQRARLSAQIAQLATSASAAMSRSFAAEERSQALRAEAFAHFDGGKRREGERAWAEASTIARSAAVDAEMASNALEASVALDPGREDLRGRLGDVLLARALASERSGRHEERDAFARRMALYDPDGTRASRFAAPASIAVVVDPPYASVVVAEVMDDSGVRVAGPGKFLGAAPVAPRPLPQGSYVAEVSAPGRTAVLVPFMAERAAEVRLDLSLPPEGAVPDGFVYVPSGRFLFGSADDEEARLGFFDATPIRPMATGDFLIAEHEVTFGEWIAFLQSLPPSEARARAPHVAARVAAGGSLLLERRNDGTWALRFQPAGLRLAASMEERVHFPGRTTRARQDWTRFPVTGIGAQDAEAYAAWLDASGRTLGARLCTEREWERAARGADARPYPHGARLAAEDAAFDETYAKGLLAIGPDEVGSHPVSRSPFGVHDMAGNAFEWTVADGGGYVVRGGSYFHDRKTARIANRAVAVESLRDATVGVRMCASPSW